MATTTTPRTSEETRTGPAALALICTGYFMVILDATVTNVALPSIGRGLHGSVTGLQWVVDAYTLSFAALLLTGGAVAERLGGRRVYTAGLVIFGTASAACALAPSLGGVGPGRFHRRAPGRADRRRVRLPGRRGSGHRKPDAAVRPGPGFGCARWGQSVAIPNPVNRRVLCQPERS